MFREIGVPILIGVLVGASVYLIPEPTPEPVFEPTPQELGVIFPFEQGPRMDGPFGTHGQVLVIAKEGRPASIEWPRGEPDHDPLTGEAVYPEAANATITWANDHVGTIDIVDLHHACFRAPCPQVQAPWVVDFPTDGARFDPANDTVQLTLYAFNEAGELVASNAPVRDVDRFDLYGDFILLGDDPWYVGNGTAPGALELPFGADQAAAALDGLPVGAIVTVHLAEHPYDWLVGELWLTGRIDAFGPA